MRFHFLLIFIFITFGVCTSAYANCVDVTEAIELGHCRARPDTKTYLGSPTPEKLWTYSCEYECYTGGALLEITTAVHQDYESNEMNSLVCKGVELDIVDIPGSIVKQCRRTVRAFEILAQNVDVFRNVFSGPKPFLVESSVRARVSKKFRDEMKEVSQAYAASAAASPAPLSDLLWGVAGDLTAIARALETPVAAARSADADEALQRYLPYLKPGGPFAVPGTREGFVVTHLGLHRDLILNLSR